MHQAPGRYKKWLLQLSDPVRPRVHVERAPRVVRMENDQLVAMVTTHGNPTLKKLKRWVYRACQKRGGGSNLR